MVADESQPPLLWIRRANRSARAQVLSYRARRDLNAELQLQFLGDSFLTPGRSPNCHLPDQLPQVLGKARSSRWPGFPSPKQAKSLPVPPDERIRFYIPESIAPGEHPAQSCHRPVRGITGPSWFNLPFLKQRQPASGGTDSRLPERGETGGRKRQDDPNRETRSAAKKQCRRAAEQNQRSGQKRSRSHVTRRYKLLPHAAEEVICGPLWTIAALKTPPAPNFNGTMVLVLNCDSTQFCGSGRYFRSNLFEI
jgi:hypothetical protein